MDVVGDDHTDNRKLHYDDVASPSIWHWLMWLIDLFTSPSFGVVMALVVIVLIHYKAVIFHFLANLVENGIQETFLDCLLNLCDLTRAYYQIVCEVIRNFFAAIGYSGATPSTGGYMNTATIDSRSSSMSAPPPLAIVPIAASSLLERKVPAVESNGNGTFLLKRQPVSGEFRHSTGDNAFSLTNNEIEPAFLDERDYPKGWLVYHPTLGVISKEEADQHDRQALSVSS